MPDIFINTERPVDRSIVAGINQPQREAPIGAFVAGSTYDTNLYFVLNSGVYDAASGAAGQDVQVAISTISTPQSGTFTLTDGTDTTAAISYGASALDVQTALNALNSDTGPFADLVTVVKQSDTQYTVTFATLGAQTALSGTSVSLYPESTPTGSIAVTGSATEYAQQVIELTRQPAIYQQTFSTITDGFNGELALNTTRLLQSLVLEAGEPFYIEVKLNGETVAREVVGMEHSTMPASSFSGAAVASLLDAFAADPNANASFDAVTWSAAINLAAANGDVVGPAVAVDGNFAAFSTTTGKLIADSGSTAADFATAAQGSTADTASQPGHTHTSNEITNNTSESTGVLTGGVLSTGAGAAEFSISDGTGQIVDATGAVTAVSFSGLSNITPANIATNLLTWVGIDSGGNLVEKVTAFTPNEIRNTIVLGVIVHTDNVTVGDVNNQQVVTYQPLSSTVDVANAIGFVNISGNQFTANGANLNINKSAGTLFKFGANYDSDTANPHNKTLAALTPVTFEYRYSDGSSQAPTLTTIDPDNLDDGAGGNTAVGNNRWSIQRIYSFVSNNVKIQRGVEDFATKSAAIEGIASEAYITEPSIASNGLLRGWLVLKKGASDLSDSGDAQFINAPKFGESSAGGASTPPGDASVILIEALKATAGTIPAGSVIRTTGYNGTRVLVELADADAAGEVPALGVTREAITDAIAGNVVVFGKLEGIDTSAFSVADTLYISTTAGELTNTRPTGATTGIQAIARVLDVDATNGIVEVVGAGRVNALPQIGVDSYWYGDGTGTPAEGTITTAGRALLDDADAAAQRVTMGVTEDTGLAVSDEETDLVGSTTVPLSTFHAQRAGTWSEILIGVTTAPTGSTLTADVHLNGTTVFSTKPTIDATEKTSVTAATAAALSTTAYAKGDLIELFCDSAGTTIAGVGLKFYFNQTI